MSHECAVPSKDLPMKKTLTFLTAVGAAALTLNAQAATKWDLPSGYPASNLHTQNLEQFVKDVSKLSGGELEIVLHNNASLYKAPEIKRAVQGNQAQIGDRKSTRLNSSHVKISYAVFCLK